MSFESNLRNNIVNAAIALDKSNLSFSTFRKSYCNGNYWERTRQGGFLLKEGASPSAAINDIYRNGSKYGTECATAIVIVFYKACLDSFGNRLFDAVLPDIYLMNWQNVDRNLGLATMDIENPLPGDCLYFKNPQVSPLTPEWQGENVIDLGEGMYYGHGVGIRTGNEIVDALNSNRVMGATQSAYLLDSATRPDFERLAHIKESS
ncbi:MAG: protein-glutamine gamma-glutamyltransferase [Clostridium sp.]|jgi:protein-glutamine gamma-glutamyltransferase|uniref:protein-glutamine gamma-glutamyltransferase n=1 Tax=Clostridium sp. TaxID=1506 RepID=UPI0025C38013|nr:protein-glutamine gamma-glutamyltransferase [Clostridium sp.]MCH3965079.1 protein-glutamine gamma-glutamyltransferase [Clostridium sp.]MCI1714300.1 protein-glutamine gamma-glutamyltransferase [Clostridium sp.]MCI1798562.1 protein-glutamine gamma-glutamyltransferase [Clostridium sp.]MCI1812707.1 protein-glutamine gamma-glutamyltransferase [Clostridium sp.]MCI1869371.1 protein-glutamine gamma-glutamyltransferase [Clostridium sp.]